MADKERKLTLMKPIYLPERDPLQTFHRNWNMGEFRVHHVRFFNFQPKAIHCIVYGNETKRIALSRSDASIEIWSIKDDWYQEKVITGSESASVETVCWQGQRLFSAGLDGDVTEYDLLRLQPKTSASSNAGPVWCLTTDSTGKHLAAGTEDGCVVLFDTDYGSLQYYRAFDKQEGRILSIAWHKNDDVIVTGGIDNIRLWSVNSGHAIQRLTLGRQERKKETIVWCVAITSDMTVISGDSRGKTIFWNGRQGTQIKSVQSHKADVLCLAVNETEDKVFTSGVEPTVVEFDYIAAHEESDWKIWVRSNVRCQHSHDVRSLAIADNVLVSGGVDTSIIINNTEAKKGVKNWRKIPGIPQHSIVHTSVQKKMLLLQYPDYLELWRLGHTRKTSEKNGEILPLESNPLKLLQLASKNNGHIVCCSLSQNAAWISYSDSDRVKLYKLDLEDADYMTPIVHLSRVKLKKSQPAHRMTFTPNSQYLVLATSSAQIEVISLESEDEVHVIHTFPAVADDPVHLLSVSDDNSTLAVADTGYRITLYDITSKQKIGQLPSYSYLPTAMSFDASTKNLILAYADQKIYEFDLEQMEYSQWCKSNCNKFPSQWQKRHSKISHITYSRKDPDKIFLHDEQMFCILDKAQPFPDRDVQLYSRQTWSKDTKKGSKAFHLCSKYKYILHLEVLEDDWMVVVERTPMALSDSLPLTLEQKKFGT